MNGLSTLSWPRKAPKLFGRLLDNENTQMSWRVHVKHPNIAYVVLERMLKLNPISNSDQSADEKNYKNMLATTVYAHPPIPALNQ